MKKGKVTKDMRDKLAHCERAIKEIQTDLPSKSKEQIEVEIKMTKELLDQFLKAVEVQYLETSFNYNYSLN